MSPHDRVVLQFWWGQGLWIRYERLLTSAMVLVCDKMSVATLWQSIATSSSFSFSKIARWCSIGDFQFRWNIVLIYLAVFGEASEGWTVPGRRERVSGARGRHSAQTVFLWSLILQWDTGMEAALPKYFDDIWLGQMWRSWLDSAGGNLDTYTLAKYLGFVPW